MAVLYGGTAFRAMMEQRAEPARLAALYSEVIERLMPGNGPRSAAPQRMSR